MATLANAAASSFVQPQRQISVETTTTAAASNTTIADCSLSQISASLTSSTSSSSSPCTSTSSSCESGVNLSSSSLINLSTSTTSSSTVSAITVKAVSDASSSSSSKTSMAASSLLSQLSSSTSSIPISSAAVTSPDSLLVAPTKPTVVENDFTAALSNTLARQMPSNGLSISHIDLNATANNSSLVEDPRALQLAFELSMVGLNDTVQQQEMQLQQLQQQHLRHMQQQQQLAQHQQQSSFDMSALCTAVAAAAAAEIANCGQPSAENNGVAQLNQFSSGILPGIEDRSKKSQNMTECVPVPSSEHVAEIVGRQGCKIKALRAKTNTYIKTPVRGEEPVFVVTGRKEDVYKAKLEILSAAEHFSVIRVSRKPSLACNLNGGLNGAGSGANATPGPPAIRGQVTIQVRVPYRVVGLVVGPKGATIKHIQQETQTYIVTPSREKEPIFEVTGLPNNVQAARKQIEAHIALRTGNLSAAAGEADTGASSSPSSMHTINTLSQILSDDISPEFLASIYKNGLYSTFDYAEGCINSLNNESTQPVSSNNAGINLNLTACNASQVLNNDIASTMSTANNIQLSSTNDFLNSIMSRSTVDNFNTHPGIGGGGINLNSNNSENVTKTSILNSATTGININGNGVVNGIGMSRSCSSASSTTSSKSANNSGGSNSSRPEFTNIWKNLSESLDVDEGIGESPSIWTPPSSLATLGSHYSTATSISPTDSLLGENSSLGQLLAIQTQQQQRTTESLNNIMPQHHILNRNHQNLGIRRECLICSDKEVTAALVPCGHNMFCMDCANRICSTPQGVCPVCSQSVFHAMRILS